MTRFCWLIDGDSHFIYIPEIFSCSYKSLNVKRYISLKAAKVSLFCNVLFQHVFINYVGITYSTPRSLPFLPFHFMTTPYPAHKHSYKKHQVQFVLPVYSPEPTKFPVASPYRKQSFSTPTLATRDLLWRATLYQSLYRLPPIAHCLDCFLVFFVLWMERGCQGSYHCLSISDMSQQLWYNSKRSSPAHNYQILGFFFVIIIYSN